MATFTNGLKDKDLIKSLYIEPPEDLDKIMDHAKTYMLSNEALRSSDDEVHDSIEKSRNKPKGSEIKQEA